MSSQRTSLRPPLGSADANEERRRLENDLAELQPASTQAIILNRQRLNALAPISYLPPDVLRHIFSLLEHGERPSVSHKNGGYFCLRFPKSEIALGWKSVTHVCSQWRRLAIETPSLWCCIPFASTRNPHWIQTFFLRSQSAPLLVMNNANLDDRDWPDIISTSIRSIRHRIHTFFLRSQSALLLATDDAILDNHDCPNIISTSIQSIRHHLCHTEELHIQAGSQAMDSLFSTLIVPALLLRRATFVVYADDSPPPTEVSRLPRELFAGNAPQLNHLSLTNCIIPWDSPSLRRAVHNLTMLTIHLPRDDLLRSSEDPYATFPQWECLPSLAQLLDLLAATPSLAYLMLENVLPIFSWFLDNHSDHHDTPAVSLPHLDCICLTGTAYDCATVSRHIRATPQADMTLKCHTGGSGFALEAQLSAIVLALEDHISHCDHRSEPSILSYINLNLGNLGDEFQISTWSYTLRVSQVPDPIIRANFIQKCLALWPVSTPTLLEICCTSSGVTAMELIRALSTEALNCVDRVMLRETAGDFFAALFEQNESATVPLLPGLQEITLQSVRLVPLIQLEIRVVLKLRKEAGVPIRRLKLDHCSGMSRSWARELQFDFGVELSYDDETQQQSRL